MPQALSISEEDDYEKTEYLKLCLDNRRYIAYDTLDEEDKILYREILACMKNLEDQTHVTTFDSDKLSQVFSVCLADHPEIFYVGGFQYTMCLANDVVTDLIFMPDYNISKEIIPTYQTRIDKVVEACKNGAPVTDDEYELVKYYYDYIVTNTEYDINAKFNQNIYSVFVNKASVCQGYARAFQYLLQDSGIDAITVTGTANGGSHAWNLVKVNGAYYYVDPTWGDSAFEFSKGKAPKGFEQPINYDYFLVTTKELTKTHVLGDTIIDVPECIETSDNYYTHEGLLLDSYDKTAIKQIFKNMYSAESRNITVKCSDEMVYELIKEKLIVNQEVFDYLRFWDDDIAYTVNPKQLTISFWI